VSGGGFTIGLPSRTIERILAPDFFRTSRSSRLFPAEGESGRTRKVSVVPAAMISSSWLSVASGSFNPRIMPYPSRRRISTCAAITLRGRWYSLNTRVKISIEVSNSSGITSFAPILNNSPTSDTYLVLVTRGHQLDEEALKLAIHAPLAYIGMIGSKRRVRAVLDHLRRHDVPGERLAAVHAPIGLSIGAETPAEIAVSILAEIVAVRRADRRRASR